MSEEERRWSIGEMARDPDLLESAARLWSEKKEAVSAHVGGAMGFDPQRLKAVVTYVEDARAIRMGQSR